MTAPLPALHIVGRHETVSSPNALSASLVAFDKVAPGLAGLGSLQTARRGEALQHSPAEPTLRFVTEGVLCLTHGDTGVCVAMIGDGAPLGVEVRSGSWLTDGAFLEISVSSLASVYGAEAALTLCNRAGAQSQTAVEAELLCAIRHPASRRFGRWFAALLRQTPEVVLTQVELARLSGLQRTSVCAAMAILQDKGGLKVTRGRIRRHDAAALEQASCRCGDGSHPSDVEADVEAASTSEPPDETCRLAG